MLTNPHADRRNITPASAQATNSEQLRGSGKQNV
jgi:hypothetical protein